MLARALALSLSALACLAGAASAQEIVLMEDFEGGLSAWHATGRWHHESLPASAGVRFTLLP